MAETLILDPSEVSLRRTEFAITSYVAQAGPDWGESAIEQFMADVQQGQLPVDYRLPNRVITIPLLLRNAALTFEQLRAQFQQKTGLFQRDGGWIKRQTPLGPLYADIVGAQLKFGGGTAQALWGIDADAILTLTTLPDWYGDEVVASAVSNPANATDLIFTLTGIKGDVAARARLVLSDLSALDIHGLLWGVRSRNYSAVPTAQLAYEADVLTPIAPAATAANANASGGNEVLSSGLSKSWTPIVSTDIAGVGSMTHVGSYRVWARVRTGATYPAGGYYVAPRVRFVWDVGDLLSPVENQAVRLPYDPDFWLADLGEIRLDQSPIGNHRWQGVIQASEGGVVAVDKIWLQPIDEAAGRLSISPTASVGLTGYSALDSFDMNLGSPTGQTMPVGGLWTFSHGDTDDFVYDSGTTFRLKRATVSDTAARFIYAATPTMAASAAQIDFYHSTPTGTGIQQAYLMLRRIDASNYVYVTVGNFNLQYYDSLRVYIVAVVAGTPTTLAVAYVPSYYDAWWTLRAAITPTGYAFAWLFPQGSVAPTDPTALRFDAARLATGGALASGKVGIGDQNSGNTAEPRYYDNFLAWPPDNDAVIFTGKSAELRFDGMYRESPGGSSFGKVSTVLGDLLRLPPSGMEARMVEVFLKPSFGDIEQASDSQLMRLQAQMRYRPSYLFVPEG